MIVSKKKIFFLATGDVFRASSRLRVWQNIELFEAKNYNCKVDHYNIGTQIYKKLGRFGPVANIIRKIFKTPIWVFQFLRSDYILLQEVVVHVFIIKLIKHFEKKIIFDFSDPIDVIDEKQAFIQKQYKLFWKKQTLKNWELSDYIVVENQLYLSMKKTKNINISVFEGPINCEIFKPILTSNFGSNTVFGWTGSPATVYMILPIIAILDELALKFPIILILIGVDDVKLEIKNLKTIFYKWSVETELEIVPKFDIGIFRIEDNITAMFRGGGKLFVYLACGIPFIATYKGIGKQIIDKSSVGFAVNSENNWKEVIELALINTELRRKYSIEGRKFALNELSNRKYVDLISNIISEKL